MPASTRCTSLGPSRETHSHVIEHQRRAYPPEQVYEHGGRTKSVHTCRAKTTRRQTLSNECVYPLSPNSKLTGMGGRPRARDKMWTLQLWVWGRGVRGKCIMQLSLLSCHIILPPRVWTLFVRAPSGRHVFGGVSLLPCLHVCAHFSVCSCMRFSMRVCPKCVAKDLCVLVISWTDWDPVRDKKYSKIIFDNL